jgi:hypothetical protein
MKLNQGYRYRITLMILLSGLAVPVSCSSPSEADCMPGSSCGAAGAGSDPANDAGGPGGSGGSAGKADAGASSTQACAQYAAAVCDKRGRCNAFGLRLFYGDIVTCRERARLECLAAVDLSDTSANSSFKSACAAALNAANCDQWLGIDPVALAACVYQPGARPNGAPCGHAAQCASDRCNVPSASDCGVCGEISGKGGRCNSSADCAGVFQCINGVCGTYPTAGQSCAVSVGCSAPLVCNNGLCARPGKAGETCTFTPDTCDGYAGTFCASGGTCQTAIYVAAGQPCDERRGYFCEKSGFCRTGATGTTGTCLAYAPDGAACNRSTGPNCMPPAVCSGGFCAAPNPRVCE